MNLNTYATWRNFKHKVYLGVGLLVTFQNDPSQVQWSLAIARIVITLIPRKISYVGFIGFFVLVFDSVFFSETVSPQMRVDYITEVIWIVIRIQQKVLVAVPNLAPSTLPTILHQNRVGRVLGMRFGRYLAITRFIYTV